MLLRYIHNNFLRKPMTRRRSVFYSTTTKIFTDNSALDPPSFETSVPPNIPSDFQSLKLIHSEIVANNTKLLSFELPQHVDDLSSLHIPSGIKVKQEVLPGLTHDKSYSPISLPNNNKQVDIVVKRYESSDPSFKGLGAYMCNDLNIGDSIDVKFKPKKLLHGKPYEANRFKNLIFIGNGTGIAPLYQMALHILDNDMEDQTNIYFISAHRSENDILLGNELNSMYEKHEQFKENIFVLSKSSNDGENIMTKKNSGRYVGLEDLKEIPLPKSIDDVETSHCIICGTDGFLEHICGMTSFAYEEDGSKHKQQGELKGLLKEYGFHKSHVTKL